MPLNLTDIKCKKFNPLSANNKKQSNTAKYLTTANKFFECFWPFFGIGT